MSKAEQKIFLNLGLPIFQVNFNNKTYVFRNSESIFWVRTIENNINIASFAFKIIEGSSEVKGTDLHKLYWGNSNQTRPKINFKQGEKYTTYEYTIDFSTENITNNSSVEIVPEKLDNLKSRILGKYAVAEEDKISINSDNKFDKMPVLKDGQALSIEYPELARQNGIENQIDFIFYVNNDGKVTDIKIIDFELELEIGPQIFIEVINSVFPKLVYTPAIDKGTAVGSWNKQFMVFKLVN